MGDPDFLYAAPPMFACAAFRRESRMEFDNATNLDRKSGGSPPLLLLSRREVSAVTWDDDDLFSMLVASLR
jgi:hypothetical protein